MHQNKSVPFSYLVPFQWHCTFRETVMKSGSTKPTYDEKWGRFKPEQRINVDQVPLPFAIDRKQTYEAPVPNNKHWPIDEFLLLCDNLEWQTKLSFTAAVSLLGGLVWYGLKNGTEVWQPVDDGVGRIPNVLIGQQQQEWLETDDNLDLWMGNR